MGLTDSDWIILYVGIADILAQLVIAAVVVYIVNIVLQKPKGPILSIVDMGLVKKDTTKKTDPIAQCLVRMKYFRSNDGDRNANFRYSITIIDEETGDEYLGEFGKETKLEYKLAPGQFEYAYMNFDLPEKAKQWTRFKTICCGKYYNNAKQKDIDFESIFYIPYDI